MFEKFKQQMSQLGDQLDDALGLAAAPPDLAAVPQLAAPAPGTRPTLDSEVIGRYVGLPVASIGPAIVGARAETYGGEVLGGFFNSMLEGSGIAEATAPGGAINEGMAERMAAEMRAEGASEEDIAAIRRHMNTDERDSESWKIEFTTGDKVTVTICNAGDDLGRYNRIAFRWWQQHHDVQYMNRQAKAREDDDFFGFGSDVDERVEQQLGTPYDCLIMGSTAYARGAVKEVSVTADRLRTKDPNASHAAIAAIILASVEGYPPPGPVPPRPEGPQ